MSKKDFFKHKDVKGLGYANNNIIHPSFCLGESFGGTDNLTCFYPLLCSVGGNLSPSLSLCLSRVPEQQPWMDWDCSPGCCHRVTEAIAVTVRVSLSCQFSSDKPGHQPCNPIQALLLLSAGHSPQVHQETQIFAILGCSLQPELVLGKESGRCFHAVPVSAVCVRERIPREG